MKEQFLISASQGVLEHIDRAADRAGFSRGQTFEDFLTFVRCSLAGQTMEEEYLRTVAKGYAKGKQQDRGIDHVARGFAALIEAMEKTHQDILGDIFTGAVTYGEHGQFFTPDSVTQIMAEMMVGGDVGGATKSVNDPACGSGRLLLAVGKKHPHWEYIGQDVDHRCAQMTAINLGLNGLRGWAVWQNTLTLECHRVYRVGFHLSGGVIREVPVTRSPFHQATPDSGRQDRETPQPANVPPRASGGDRQLDLF